jgi:uncharacterized protein (TIGR03435 family)
MRLPMLAAFLLLGCLTASSQNQSQPVPGGAPARGTAAGRLPPGRGPDSETRGNGPEFDAVSVKPLGAAMATGGLTVSGLHLSPGRVSGNDQIQNLIMRAYSVETNELVLPDIAGLRLNRYQIDATMPVTTTPDETNLMFRAMLIERFGLRFHRETRKVPVYALVAGAKPKLESVVPEALKERVYDTPFGPHKGCSGAISRDGMYTAYCVTMYEFGLAMSHYLDRKVVDDTGLPGTYAIDLQWDSADPAGLIFAIQKKLGLKLEKRIAAFDMFVVDHIDTRPTPN